MRTIYIVLFALLLGGCSKYLTKSDGMILVDAHNQLVAKIQELEKLCPKPTATPEVPKK